MYVQLHHVVVILDVDVTQAVVVMDLAVAVVVLAILN
jgi:hypothetical protein